MIHDAKRRALTYVTLMSLLLSLIPGVVSAAVSPTPAALHQVVSDVVSPDAETDARDDNHDRRPIKITVDLDVLPVVGESADVSILVQLRRIESVDDLVVALHAIDGLEVTGQSKWTIDVTRGRSVELTSTIAVRNAGNQTLSASAHREMPDGSVVGGSGEFFFSSTADTATRGHEFEGDRASIVAAGAPGLPSAPSTELTGYPDGSAPAPSDGYPIAPRGDAGSETAVAEASAEPSLTAGTIKITGHASFPDKNGTTTPVALLVQLLSTSDTHLGFIHSGLDGYYEFNVPNPGQFKVRFYTYYNHIHMSGRAIRVVPNDAGGDFFNYSNAYNATTGAMGPFADGTTDIGWIGPNGSAPTRSAWWIHKAVLDAYLYLNYNGMNPGGTTGSKSPDGSTLMWQSDSTVGTFFDFTNVRLLAVDAYSDHTSVHEYGHNVMQNVYGFFPTNDCSSPHFINRNDPTNCSWTEGFADFLPLASLNDPVYKWGCFTPCTPSSIDLENATFGTSSWDNDEFVEGRVAGALYDLVDSNNEGYDLTDSSLTPLWRIWDVFWAQSDNTFAEFWAAWVSRSHPSANARSSLYQNTITYGYEACPDLAQEPRNNGAGTSIQSTSGNTYNGTFCTDKDPDWWFVDVTAGSAYRFETLNLNEGSTSFTTDTYLELYDSNGSTLITQNDDGGTTPRASLVTYTPPSSKRVYVKVLPYSSSHAGGNDQTYQYKVTSTVANTPPTVTEPVHLLGLGATVGGTSIPGRVSWTASDSNGIAGYDLDRSLDGAAFANYLTPTSSSVKVQYQAGKLHRYQVAARDTLGAWSSYVAGRTFKAQVKQENTSGMTYSTGWTRSAVAGASGGYARVTQRSGAQMTYQFVGRSIGVLTTTANGRGTFDVYIDNVKRCSADTQSSTRKTAQLVCSINGLTRGVTHTIKIVSTSTKTIDIDAVVILSS